MARRKHYLFVCTNRRPEAAPRGSCAARGSDVLFVELKEALKRRGLSEYGVRACSSSCLDVCGAGPTIAVTPDGYFYGRVQVSDVPEIVDALERGERVERLVVSEADMEAG
jgi:(2Fe-2S) ferredoxin